MNQQQIKYAKIRIERIKSDLLKAIQDKYKYIRPNLGELLEEGSITINIEKVKKLGGGTYLYLKDVVDGYDFSKDIKDIDNKKRNAITKVNEATTVALDELMLGDNKEASKLISKLTKLKI